MVYSVLNECLVHGNLKHNNILNEISSDDAYIKFYSNIPKDLYDTVMSDTNKMTPFHKALLDVVVNFINHGTEERTILQYISSVKNKYQQLTSEQRKYCVARIKERDFTSKDNHFDLQNILRASGKQIEVTNKTKAKEGLIVLYEDNNILVTCTTTYAASKHYYGNTHWCTSSGIDGNMSGYKSFRSYVKNDRGDYCLIQFVSKNQKDDIWQGMFDRYGAIVDFKNFYDDGDTDDFDSAEDSPIYEIYKKHIKGKIPQLIKLTSENYYKEEETMRPVLITKVNKILEKQQPLPTKKEMSKILSNRKLYDSLTLNPNLKVKEKSTSTYILITVTQKPDNYSDYQFVTNTKDITNLDFKTATFVYSIEAKQIIDLPEGFSDSDRVLMLYGDVLFSCAVNHILDTNTFNLNTKQIKHYDISYGGLGYFNNNTCLVFWDKNSKEYWFSAKTGKLIGSR